MILTKYILIYFSMFVSSVCLPPGLTMPSSSGMTIYQNRSVRVAERLALPTSDHGVAGSNLAGGEILPEPKRRFIAQSLSCSPFHSLEITEILLKGRKTLTHPSIQNRRGKFRTLNIRLESFWFHCLVASVQFLGHSGPS